MYENEYLRRIKTFFINYFVIIGIMFFSFSFITNSSDIIYKYIGFIPYMVPFITIQLYYFGLILLTSITIDSTGFILPVKLCGYISDVFIIGNKYTLISLWILVCFVVYLFFKEDRKKNDILSILSYKYIKHMGGDESELLMNKLKYFHIDAKIQLLTYGWSANKYIVNEYNCKISRLKVCLTHMSYMLSRNIVSYSHNDKIIIELYLEKTNNITLRDYLDILQIDSLVLLDTLGRCILPSLDSYMFINEDILFNNNYNNIHSLLLILLLSKRKNEIFLINPPESLYIYSNICSIMSLNTFIDEFDQINNDHSKLNKPSKRRIVFIFNDEGNVVGMKFLLKYSKINYFTLILVNKVNTFYFNHSISYQHGNNIMYEYKYFKQFIMFPNISSIELQYLIKFLEHQI